MVSKHRERYQSGWTHRRRIIYSTLILCACVILYITYNGADTRIYETIVTSAFSLAGLIISVYVLGATYEDVSVSKLISHSTAPITSKEVEEDAKDDI